MTKDELQERLAMLIGIYNVQVILATRKKHKLHIYEAFVADLEKLTQL